MTAAVLENPSMRTLTTSASTPLSPSSTKPLPHLSPENLSKAAALAEQIDPSNPQMVLSLGGQAQEKLALFSSAILQQTKVADSGTTGALLGKLQIAVRNLSPDSLQGPKGLAYAISKILPWGESLQQRIDNFAAKHESIKPAMEFLSKALKNEQEKAGQGIEVIKGLKKENRDYVGVLQIAQAAISLAYNKATESYERERLQLNGSEDISQIGDLRGKWNDLERMDRRRYAIEASIVLANTYEVQLNRIGEMLCYNCETLNEARVFMIPTWETKIAAAITAMQAKDQATMVRAFRSMNDELVEGTGALIADTELAQADMQKRTFVAAAVIAKVNDGIAASITKALTIQQEAKTARDEGLTIMLDSQNRLVEAMRSAGKELVATSALNLSAKPATQDLMAELVN